MPELLQGLDDRLQQLADDVKTTAGPNDLWRRVRAEFQMNPGLIHLNCGTLGATPRVVIDSVLNYSKQRR